MRVVFLHGLESGPHGSKYQLLGGLGLGEVLAPDCYGVLDPGERLLRIREVLKGEASLLLVGSSFGGLMALRYAERWPEQVAGLVLCAPAVHRADWPAPPAPRGIPLAVLHGRQDEVVPLAAVLAWAGPDLQVTVVEDGHRLEQSRAVLAQLVQDTWRRLEPPSQRPDIARHREDEPPLPAGSERRTGTRHLSDP